MRLQLLVIFWFALTAWSGQVAASAMAHCQTHAAKTGAFEASNKQNTSASDLDPSDTGKALLHFAPAPNSLVAAYTGAHQTHNDHPTNANLHDCCDSDNDQHHCSSGCSSCDGCSTAHGAAMPVLWLMKTAMTQQKIQYSAYSYLNLHSSTQERPPKR